MQRVRRQYSNLEARGRGGAARGRAGERGEGRGEGERGRIEKWKVRAAVSVRSSKNLGESKNDFSTVMYLL